MKLLSKILLAGGLSLATMGSYAHTPDLADTVKTFYQGYVKSGGVLTPELRKQLLSSTAESYAKWEQCTAGIKSACASDCEKDGCLYGFLFIEKNNNYFTKTAKINPAWATKVNPKVTFTDKRDGYAMVTLAIPGAPALGINGRYEDGQWKIGLVDRKGLHEGV